MISGKIKNALYAKKIKNAVKSRAGSNVFASGKLGLITDAEDTETIKILASLPEELGFKTGDSRFILCDAEAELITGLKYIRLNSKEVNTSGVFKSEAVKELFSEDFKLLICFFSEKQTAGTLLATRLNSGLIFGNTPDRFGVYDVEISAGSVRDFQQEVKKYFKIFKTK